MHSPGFTGNTVISREQKHNPVMAFEQKSAGT
jgi:hypothetical protein